MARAKNPEQAISELQAERSRLAGERHELAVALQDAKAVLAAAPEVRRRALVDAARGRGDRVAHAEAEIARAEAAVGELTPRVDALRVAEEEIGEEARAVFESDEGVAFFTAKATRASEEAAAARVIAEAAYRDLRSAWLESERQWGELRRAARHRGEEESAPREVPRPEFLPPIPTATAHYGPWPGGSRERHEQERDAVERRRSNPPPKVSTREAIVAFTD